MATDKKKISVYLDEEVKESVEKLAKARGLKISSLIAFVLSKEIRAAKQSGEI